MKFVIFFFEKLFFSPQWFHYVVAFLLLPFSFVYGLIVFLKYRLTTCRDFGLPIISVGNLVVGGMGKTPITLKITQLFSLQKTAIILRGFGRKSQGLFVIKHNEKILHNVDISGDEAALYAQKSPKNCIVIVSENRVLGIEKAKKLGACLILLDDGYSKHYIKKLDLLIQSDTKNPFLLPSGPFREKLWKSKKAIVIKENKDFKRQVTLQNFQNKTPKSYILVTAISKPERLEPFLPSNIAAKYFFTDHRNFSFKEIQTIVKKHPNTYILTTQKDEVKLKKFNFPLCILQLNMWLNPKLEQQLINYVKGFNDQTCSSLITKQ